MALEAVEASLNYFFENWLMKLNFQTSGVPKQNLNCIFLPFSQFKKNIFQCEQPCSMVLSLLVRIHDPANSYRIQTLVSNKHKL